MDIGISFINLIKKYMKVLVVLYLVKLLAVDSNTFRDLFNWIAELKLKQTSDFILELLWILFWIETTLLIYKQFKRWREEKRNIELPVERHELKSKDSIASHEAGHVILYHEFEKVALSKGVLNHHDLPKLSVKIHEKPLKRDVDMYSLGHLQVEGSTRKAIANCSFNYLTMLMGGRVAEMALNGHHTSGSESDMRQFEDVARDYLANEETPYLYITSPQNKVEYELNVQSIQKLKKDCEIEAKNILMEKLELLKDIKALMLQKEALTDVEIRTVLNARKSD